MQNFLLDYCYVEVSIITVYRSLKAARWSRKIATKAARERSEPLRAVFRARLQGWRADQVVAVDESAAHERTSDRKYGWSPINTPCEAAYSFKHSERWSLLPAMTIDGYITHMVFQGAITSEIFERFLEYQVLPLCNPWPAERSILLLDNASIHRSPRVRDLCLQAGIMIEYLPPYSPDYNPIEQSFKVMKSWMKRNNEKAEIFSDFGYFLELAVNLCCYTERRGSASYFKYCGYVLDGQ